MCNDGNTASLLARLFHYGLKLPVASRDKEISSWIHLIRL